MQSSLSAEVDKPEGFWSELEKWASRMSQARHRAVRSPVDQSAVSFIFRVKEATGGKFRVFRGSIRRGYGI